MREAGERLRTSILLKKFFHRLLGEAKHLAADACYLRVVDEELLVVLQQNGQELKTIKLKAVWFTLLSEWLIERKADWMLESAEVLMKDGSSTGFRAAVAVEQDLASFCVVMREGELSFELHDLVFEPRATGLERLGLSDLCQHTLSEISELSEGTVVACGPNDYETRRSLSSILSLYGWHYVGDLRTSDLRQVLPMLAAQNLVVTSLAASDAWEAFKSIRAFELDPLAINLNLIIVQTFIPRVCVGCATEQQWSADQLSALHPALRSLRPTKGRVGTGCQACNGTGVKDKIGVQSFLHVNRDSFKSVGGESDATLLRYFFESGLRPFIFDGIKKAQAGLISFDQTIQNCPSLSSDFQKIGANSGLGISASWQEYSSKVIDRQQQGFAPGTPGQVSGRIENEHSLKQDGPLFSVGRSGKVRSMPLLLVVEDDLDQRQILELVFSSAGYNVTLADNGEEAWKQVESEMPDLIVTDLMMPVMDGVTFLRQLKADSRFKAIPVLVLTVVSDVDKEYELLTAGADDYCEKSVQRKILLRRIENLLRRTGVSVSK